MAFDSTIRKERFLLSVQQQVTQVEAIKSDNERAALIIQKLWRGHFVRIQRRKEHRLALLIQKVYRGWLARRWFRLFLKESLFLKHLNYYNDQATVIQKWWRAYYSRKYIHDFYARKKFLATLERNNAELRKGIEEKEKAERIQAQEEIASRKKAQEEKKLLKSHLYLSTKASPGILHGKGNTEQRIISLTRAQPRYATTLPPPAPPFLSTLTPYPPPQDTAPSSCPHHSHTRHVALKPVQGPFKPVEETLRMRETRVVPQTVRCAAPYELLDEALKETRAQTKRDLTSSTPFKANFSKNTQPYQPSLHAQTVYHGFGPKDTRSLYGSVMFRAADPPSSRPPPLHTFAATHKAS